MGNQGSSWCTGMGRSDPFFFLFPFSLCLLLFTVDTYVGRNGGGDISHQHTPGKQLKK